MISIIDLFSFVLLVYAGWKGYRMGFITMVFDILAFALSFYMALKYFRHIGQFLQKTLHIQVRWTDSFSWDNVVIWILTYLFFFVAFKLMGWVFTKLFAKTILGDWNWVAGLTLNGFKWLILLWIILAFLMQIPSKKLGIYCEQSYMYKSYKAIVKIFPIQEFLPEKLRIKS